MPAEDAGIFLLVLIFAWSRSVLVILNCVVWERKMELQKGKRFLKNFLKSVDSALKML